MSKLGAALAVVLIFAAPAFACQECVILQMDSGIGRAVDMKGNPLDRVQIRIREAANRVGERPKVLSCLHNFAKGRIVKSVKSDNHGLFTFQDLPPGTYWVAIRGKHTQSVHAIKVSTDLKHSLHEPVEFHASENGLVGNQCDILQAKDFM